jgi:hypothetical protein
VYFASFNCFNHLHIDTKIFTETIVPLPLKTETASSAWSSASYDKYNFQYAKQKLTFCGCEDNYD